MPIASVLTPMPRRHPTVLVLASRGTVRAVPFSPRSATPPPPTTPPPPPTPTSEVHLPAAFDALSLIASSSSVTSDFERPRPRAAALAAGTVFPRTARAAVIEIHAMDARGKAPASIMHDVRSNASSGGHRTPPAADSPPAAQVLEPNPIRSGSAGLSDDEEEIESGDISSGASSELSWKGHT
ncbi:hypothetical protein C2845_PM09G11070 [Panicum miliaceum]|uniref:Uncharacterized protein n=1 Tax=Panicum miliaceum TaxID=4540 RepID=A0A3L6S252_PANMI|nr:hypothetical protein C2845_PM09G11070 [Panicum miliaceum]